MNRETASTLLSTLGLLTIMVAALLPLLRVALDAFRIVYAAGAGLLLVGRLLTPAVHDAPLRLRRLLRMEVWTALIFVAGAVFLFLKDAAPKDWIAFTLAGGALTVYTSVMIPRQKTRK